VFIFIITRVVFKDIIKLSLLLKVSYFRFERNQSVYIFAILMRILFMIPASEVIQHLTQIL